jgi:hypothetical protein
MLVSRQTLTLWAHPFWKLWIQSFPGRAFTHLQLNQKVYYVMFKILLALLDCTIEIFNKGKKWPPMQDFWINSWS